MEYSKLIKSYLSDEKCADLLTKLNLQPDYILKAASNDNLCCANSSFLFVYIEQADSFLALSFNRLCKTSDKSLSSSIQRLSVNALPVGKFKKCLMNAAGTYILVVYDKCLSVVELPSKWGKYDQYNGGSTITMCKSNKLSQSIDIIDAIWHRRADQNFIVCLTADNFLRIFNCENLKSSYKEYHLQNIFHYDDINKIDNKTSFSNIDIGSKFSYNGKFAYSIYILKPNGQLECLIDYESTRNFEYLGELQLAPYSEMLDNNPKVISFMCLPIHPNCLVLILNTGTIFHCLFMPKTYGFENFNENHNQSYDEEQNNAEFNNEAHLYIYESLNLSETILKVEDIQFLCDPSNSSRYFILHPSGVHSVYMPWLENLQISYLNQNTQCGVLAEFDEQKLCEVEHLISTQPVSGKNSVSSIIGLTILFGFGSTDSLLIGLNNNGVFICANIQKRSNLDNARLEMLNIEMNIEKNYEESSSVDKNEFTNYIAGILKRQVNLPILSDTNTENLSENELNLFMKQITNLIRFEYIEKQKKVMLEFQKRSKLLKQQEQLQFEIVKEINTKAESLKEKRTNISQMYEDHNAKQIDLKKNMENCFSQLLVKRPLRMNENEQNIHKDLKSIKEQLENYDFEIKDNKQIMNRNESLAINQSKNNIDSNEIDQLRNLIKNENEKIKSLVQKVQKLKVAVKI